MQAKKYTRRQMLTTGIHLVTGLSLFANCKKTSQQDVVKPGRFKIGICDWNLKKTADPSALEVARNMGFDGVQVSLGTIENDMHLRHSSVQEKYLEMAKKFNIEIASLAIGALNDVPYKSDPRAEEWVSDCIDVCKTLGVKIILIPFFGDGDLRNDSDGVNVVVSRLKQIAPKAEQAGVVLGLESYLSATEHQTIIEQVGSPAIKVYYDVANSSHAGYAIYQEIISLGDQICEFHAKDNDDLFGKGSIDFVRVQQSIDDIHYQGWIIMEPVKFPLGFEESCRYNLAYLRQIFG